MITRCTDVEWLDTNCADCGNCAVVRDVLRIVARISGFGRGPWGGNQICSPPSLSFPNSLCNIGPTLSYYRKLRIPAV